MNAITTAPRQATSIAERTPHPQSPAGLQRQLEQGRDQLRMALPAHIDAEKFQRTVMTAAQSNPDLLRADRQSLFTAMMKCAQDGLLPDGREAALVIFNNRVKNKDSGQWESVQLVQYMPMVYGLRKKILQSGEVRDITAKVVYLSEYQSGAFHYEEGSEATLRHKPDLLLTDADCTDEKIVAAYSIATYMDGTKSYEVMTRAEINKVRQVSKTGAEGMTKRDGSAIPPKGPWVDWFGEMAKKTVMRRHAKTLPMSGDILDGAIEDEGDERLIAHGATSTLKAVEEEPRAALPSRDTPVEAEPAHDPVTGEIVDEEDERAVAERLDRETFARAEGTATDDGDPGLQPEESGAVESDPPAGADVAADLIARAARASTIIDVNKIDKEFEGAIAALDDAQYDAVKNEIAAARTRLGGKAKG